MERKVNNRSIGVNFNQGYASVSVWAPAVKEMKLFLPDKDKYIPLNRSSNGYWNCITDEIQIGDLYYFLLDGKNFPDPASLSQPNGVHKPSQAINLKQFNWSDAQWNNIPLADYIFYEVHTGTFTEQGTFAGIEEKLDYLKKLGITAIEIMPVAQFSGERNWGYDGVFPFAVQNSYGGAAALQYLINVCHKKEIAVVLDVVYNHLGPEGNNLKSFGHYFTDRYQTPWGEAVNFDDAWCDEVRNYFIENALMWFRDFHVDALRLDAVHAIKDFSPVHILKEIRLAVDELTAESGKPYYLIAECDLNDIRYIQSVKEGGYGLDAQWNDEFHHALRVTSGIERRGYYTDFNGIRHLAKAYRDAYVYDGIYSEHRKKKFGTSAVNRQGQQFVIFSQNHDHVGNRMFGERTSVLDSFEKQKLLAGAVLVGPFLPLLFMGEEYSEQNPFLYFVHHSDSALIEGVRKGRKEEFAAFHLKGEAPDPQDEKTFNKSKLQWHLLAEQPHATMFRYYQYFISLRKRLPSLKKLNRQAIRVEANEKAQVLLIERWHNDQRVFCAMNFSPNKQMVTTPSSDHSWNKLIDSSDVDWKGPGGSALVLTGKSLLSLQPECIVLYLNENV
jgi:maltooligosyltrehalose trehalohydrolase